MNARKITLIAVLVLFAVGCGTSKKTDKRAELTESQKTAMQQKCGADSARACKRLAKMWSRREGDDARAKAREYYAKACTLGDRTSCLLREVANPVTDQMLASLGDDIDEVDLPQFQRYCLGGEDDYCNAMAYFLWEENAEPDDIWVLRRSFAVACVKGYDDFCTHLSTTLDRGFGDFDRDPHAAFLISDYACDKREHGPSCHFKGVAYQAAESVEYDEVLSAEFTMKGCDYGHMPACADSAHDLRMGRGIELDAETGVELARKSCRAEAGGGCRALGYFYLSGKGVPKDIEDGVDHLEEGCEYGDPRSCFEAGRIIEEAGLRPRQEAVEFYTEAESTLIEFCERRRIGWSCAWLADVYAQTDIKRESRYSQELLRKRGCRLDPRYCDLEKLEEEKYEGTL